MLFNQSEEKILENIMSQSSKVRISNSAADPLPNYHGITLSNTINRKCISAECLVQYIDNFKKIYYLNTKVVNKNLDKLPTDYLNLRQSIDYFYRKPQEPATEDETFCINSWNSINSFKRHYIKHKPEFNEMKNPLEYTQMAINLLQNTDKWCCFCVLYDDKKHCYTLNVIDENFYLGVYYLSPPRIGRIITFFRITCSRININGYFKGNKYTVLKPNVLENYKQPVNTVTENTQKLDLIDESEESSLETFISDRIANQMRQKQATYNVKRGIPPKVIQANNVKKSANAKKSAVNIPTCPFPSSSQSTLSQISQSAVSISSPDSPKTKYIQKTNQFLTK